MDMNHTQRGIAGTVAIALIVAALFYIPWRITSTGDLAWAPFYRNPAVGTTTRVVGGTVNRFIELKGQPVWWLYGVQLAVIAGAGAVAVRMSRGEDEA